MAALVRAERIRGVPGVLWHILAKVLILLYVGGWEDFVSVCVCVCQYVSDVTRLSN